MTPLSPATGHPSAIQTEARSALETAIDTTRRNIEKFGATYPDDTTADGVYPLRPAWGDIPEGGNRGWTTCFVPGMQWIAWESTGDDAFKDAALQHARDFERRLNVGQDLDTHDLGFLYSLSCVAAWRLTGDEDARQAGLAAADHLIIRFLEPAGIVQAWGDLSDPNQAGRTIIDSLMNMPLLTWAYEQTGDERYADVVQRHTLEMRDHMLRPDDSTFHTFYWDVETGEPLRGGTEQGAHDDSCWARGQAWGIYGFALNFRATGDKRFLDASRRCAAYFLAHLPADSVAYWDLVYTDGSDAPRDSSAAAIAVSGLRELAIAEDDAEFAARATEAADRILASLIEKYTPADDESDALILHGVYNLPGDHGVDEGNLWGDYFYMEALMRTVDPEWRLYW